MLWQIIPLTFFIHWLSTLVPYGSLIYITLFTFLAALIHIELKKVESKEDKIIIMLWYFVVIIGGFGSLRNFVGHFFLSDMVAESIGWQKGTPFQIELAFYHLGVSIASLLAIWLRKNLIIGIAIIKIIFGLGAAYVHFKDIVENENYSPSNTGVVLAGNIVMPLIFIFLLILFWWVSVLENKQTI